VTSRARAHARERSEPSPSDAAAAGTEAENATSGPTERRLKRDLEEWYGVDSDFIA